MTALRSFALVPMVALVLATAAPVVDAGGRRSASPKQGSSPSVARSVPSRSASSARPPAAARETARGRATYGYGWTGYDPWARWAGWYGPYWGWGGWWYPSYVDPYWGWPYPPAPGVVPGGTPPAAPPDAPGTIETAVTPKNASLRVDGEDLGRAKDFNGTWDALRLPPGVHVLEFSRDGYQTFRAVVDVRPGRTYRIGRDLREGSGLDPDSDPLPAAGAEPAERAEPVISADAAGTGMRGALAVGFLDLTVRPADAAVYLDGSFLARGDELDRLHGAIPVAAGTHRVEVVRPGHVSKTLLVEVKSGDRPTSLEVTLEPER